MTDLLLKLVVCLAILECVAIASVSTLSIDAASENQLGELKYNEDADLTAVSCTDVSP